MKRKNYLKLLCLFALLLCSGHMQALEKRHLNIIFIGNSITSVSYTHLTLPTIA